MSASHLAPTESRYDNNVITGMAAANSQRFPIHVLRGGESGEVREDEIADYFISHTGYVRGKSAKTAQWILANNDGKDARIFDNDEYDAMLDATAAQARKMAMIKLSGAIAKGHRDIHFDYKGDGNGRSLVKEPAYDDRLNLKMLVDSLEFEGELAFQGEGLTGIDAAIRNAGKLSFTDVLTNHPTESNSDHFLRHNIAISQVAALYQAYLPTDELDDGFAAASAEYKSKLIKILDDYHVFMERFSEETGYSGYTLSADFWAGLVGEIRNSAPDRLENVTQTVMDELTTQLRTIAVAPKGKMNTDDEARRNAMYMELIMDHALDFRHALIRRFELKYGEEFTPEKRYALETSLEGMMKVRDWNADADGKPTVTGETMNQGARITRSRVLLKLARQLETQTLHDMLPAEVQRDMRAVIQSLKDTADYICLRDTDPEVAYTNTLMVRRGKKWGELEIPGVNWQDAHTTIQSVLAYKADAWREATLENAGDASLSDPFGAFRFLANSFIDVKKDVRQSSNQISAAVSEIIESALGYNYPGVKDPAMRVQMIREIIQQPDVVQEIKRQLNVRDWTGDTAKEIGRFMEVARSPEMFANVIIADAGYDGDNIRPHSFTASVYEALLMANLFDVQDKVDILPLIEDVKVLETVRAHNEYENLLKDPVYFFNHLVHRVDERTGEIRVHNMIAGSDLRRRGSNISGMLASDIQDEFRQTAHEAGEYWKILIEQSAADIEKELPAVANALQQAEQTRNSDEADKKRPAVEDILFRTLIKQFVRCTYVDLTADYDNPFSDETLLEATVNDILDGKYNDNNRASAYLQVAKRHVESIMAEAHSLEDIKGMYLAIFAGYSGIHMRRGGPGESSVYSINEKTTQGAEKFSIMQNPITYIQSGTRLLMNHMRQRVDNKPHVLDDTFMSHLYNKQHDIYDQELRADRGDRFANELVMMLGAPADLTVGIGNTTARGQRGEAKQATSEGTLSTINIFNTGPNTATVKLLNMPREVREKEALKYTAQDTTRAIKQSKVNENSGSEYDGYYGMPRALKEAAVVGSGDQSNTNNISEVFDANRSKYIGVLAERFKTYPEFRKVVLDLAVTLSRVNYYDAWSFMPEQHRPAEYQTMAYRQSLSVDGNIAQSSFGDEQIQSFASRPQRDAIVNSTWRVGPGTKADAKGKLLSAILNGSGESAVRSKSEVLNFVAGFMYQAEHEEFNEARELVFDILQKVYGQDVMPDMQFDDYAMTCEVDGVEFTIRNNNGQLTINGHEPAYASESQPSPLFEIDPNFHMIKLGADKPEYYTVHELLAKVETEKNLQLLNPLGPEKDLMRMRLEAARPARALAAEVHRDVVIEGMTLEEKFGMESSYSRDEQSGALAVDVEKQAGNLERVLDVLRTNNSTLNGLSDISPSEISRQNLYIGEMAMAA